MDGSKHPSIADINEVKENVANVENPLLNIWAKYVILLSLLIIIFSFIMTIIITIIAIVILIIFFSFFTRNKIKNVKRIDNNDI